MSSALQRRAAGIPRRTPDPRNRSSSTPHPSRRRRRRILARRDELTLWTAPDAEDACDAEGAHQWPHQPWEGSESRYGVDDLRLGDGVFDALPLHRAASRRDEVAAPVRSV